MADAFEQVLRLVAEGRLSAEQAGPILDALALDEDLATHDDLEPDARPAEGAPSGDRPPATAIRIEITERGRKVVNLRIPASLGRFALDRVPGISGTDADIVRRALADGRSGTLLDIDEDGSGVRIALE